MRVAKGRFDGKKVELTEKIEGVAPGEVLVIFDGTDAERRQWERAQEEAFAKAWDNDEDAEYDRL